MVCCRTLQKCVSSIEACPNTYPASSQQSCRSDGDCPLGELCESWTVEGAPAGPGRCRRDCSEGYTCAQGELCDPAPHDGRSLQDVQVARMCVSANPEPGCEGQGCHTCPVGTLGGTYCEGNTVRGCFFATHPKCGLTCRPVLVSDCDRQNCFMEAGVAQCEKVNVYGSPCFDLSCSKCGGEPGSFFCDGGAVSVCVAIPATRVSCGGECECDQLCAREVVQTCASCSLADGTPTCLP
jgi:hypothetical protein